MVALVATIHVCLVFQTVEKRKLVDDRAEPVLGLDPWADHDDNVAICINIIAEYRFTVL